MARKETCAVLHAGWMATFKHPINFEELKLPPCVGASAYTDEEQNWCAATLHYYVDGMDAARRAARGIPESAVTRQCSGRPTAGGVSGGDGFVEASPAGGASGGAGRVGPRRGCGSARASCRWTPSCQGGDGAAEGNDSAAEEDEICASSQITSRKRGRGQCRQAHFL